MLTFLCWVLAIWVTLYGLIACLLLGMTVYPLVRYIRENQFLIVDEPIRDHWAVKQLPFVLPLALFQSTGDLIGFWFDVLFIYVINTHDLFHIGFFTSLQDSMGTGESETWQRLDKSQSFSPIKDFAHEIHMHFASPLYFPCFTYRVHSGTLLLLVAIIGILFIVTFDILSTSGVFRFAAIMNQKLSKFVPIAMWEGVTLLALQFWCTCACICFWSLFWEIGNWPDCNPLDDFMQYYIFPIFFCVACPLVLCSVAFPFFTPTKTDPVLYVVLQRPHPDHMKIEAERMSRISEMESRASTQITTTKGITEKKSYREVTFGYAFMRTISGLRKNKVLETTETVQSERALKLRVVWGNAWKSVMQQNPNFENRCEEYYYASISFIPTCLGIWPKWWNTHSYAITQRACQFRHIIHGERTPIGPVQRSASAVLCLCLMLLPWGVLFGKWGEYMGFRNCTGVDLQRPRRPRKRDLERNKATIEDKYQKELRKYRAWKGRLRKFAWIEFWTHLVQLCVGFIFIWIPVPSSIMDVVFLGGLGVVFLMSMIYRMAAGFLEADLTILAIHRRAELRAEQFAASATPQSLAKFTSTITRTKTSFDVPKSSGPPRTMKKMVTDIASIGAMKKMVSGVASSIRNMGKDSDSSSSDESSSGSGSSSYTSGSSDESSSETEEQTSDQTSVSSDYDGLSKSQKLETKDENEIKPSKDETRQSYKNHAHFNIYRCHIILFK